MDFNNKVVIITGSSSGIGKITALELCKQGAKVVLNGRNFERLENTRMELLNKGYDVIAVQGDITSVVDCSELVNKTAVRYGKIDILINNASLTMNDSIENIAPHIFQDVMLSNSIGAAFPTMAALPYLKETNGSVIFISSLAGLHGMPSASGYCMGKMAITSLWQSYQVELAHTGVHFGICYLGFTQNGEDKRMLQAGGSLVKVPNRPSYLQKTQIQVANIILNTIKKRKKRVIVSTLGKVLSVAVRFFPKLMLFIMSRTQKRQAKYKMMGERNVIVIKKHTGNTLLKLR